MIFYDSQQYLCYQENSRLPDREASKQQLVGKTIVPIFVDISYRGLPAVANKKISLIIISNQSKRSLRPQPEVIDCTMKKNLTFVLKKQHHAPSRRFAFVKEE